MGGASFLIVNPLFLISGQLDNILDKIRAATCSINLEGVAISLEAISAIAT